MLIKRKRFTYNKRRKIICFLAILPMVHTPVRCTSVITEAHYTVVTLPNTDQLLRCNINLRTKSSTHQTYLAPFPINPSFLLSPPRKTAITLSNYGKKMKI